MGSVRNNPGKPHGRRGKFVTTRWSIVVAARAGESAQSRDALSVLCKAYWYPLYAYARRRGYRAEQAEDLTQGFFARFLEKNDVQDADRSRGKFRSFLLAAFKHYLANEHDRECAQKRGGQYEFVSLNSEDAERKYNSSLGHALTPDQEYEKQWAFSVLEGVVIQLKSEYAAAGKQRVFDQLQQYLPGAVATVPYEECARRLAISEAAVKMAVQRLRRRYRQILRSRIADTLADTGSVDEEIRYLLDVIGS